MKRVLQDIDHEAVLIVVAFWNPMITFDTIREGRKGLLTSAQASEYRSTKLFDAHYGVTL